MEFQEARENGNGPVVSGEKSTDGNQQIAARKDKAQDLAGRGPTRQGHDQERHSQDNMGKVVRKSMMMGIVSARDVEKGEDPKHHVKDPSADEKNFARLMPHR
jgi:hypothetical protein